MVSITIPISERARKYGYIFWPATLDNEVKDFLGEADSVKLHFQGADHGKKKVDWKYRRVSIGYRWTRRLPKEVSQFVLAWKEKRTLSVICR